MATRGEIEFDFQRAKAQAEKIDRIADRLRNLSQNDFDDSLQNLSAGWKGESASLYLQKGGALQDKIVNTASELYVVADDIRTIAKRIYEAEIAALKIAQERSY